MRRYVLLSVMALALVSCEDATQPLSEIKLEGRHLNTTSAIHRSPTAYITNNLFLLTQDRATPNTVTVVDIADDSRAATVTVGVGAFNVAITPDGAFAYVTNLIPIDDPTTGQIGEVSVIETASNTVVATVLVGRLSRGLAITPTGTHVFVANSGAGTVSIIETASNTVVATPTISAAADGSAFIVITPDGQFAYITHFITDRVSVLDVQTKTVTMSIPVGDGPGRLAITPDGQFVYVRNVLDGTLSVIDVATNSVVTTVPVGTMVEAEGLAFTPDGNFLYVPHAVTVSVVETASNTVVKTIAVNTPWGIAVTPDGRFVYVTNIGTNTATVIETATNTIVRTVPDVGFAPHDIAFTPFVSVVDQLEALIVQVQELVANGVLNGGQGNSLIRKLENAIVSIENDNTSAAVGQLGAFVNQVEDFMADGTLAAEEGQLLIDAAQNVLDQLEA